MPPTTRSHRIENALACLDTCQRSLEEKQRELLLAVVRGEEESGLQAEVDRLSDCVMESLDELEAAFRG